MLKKTFSLFPFFFLCAVYPFAQLTSPLIFSQITKKEGLVSSTVFATVRDNDGFLWIASQNGLQRYDRNHFLTFRHIPGDTSSLPANTINGMFLDNQQRLWLIFEKHVGIFNTRNFHFRKAAIDSAIFKVKKLTEDNEGHLILFADNKMLAYDEVNHNFLSPYTLPALPAGYTITDMTVDPLTGLYWFTGKQGSLLYDPKLKQFYSYDQNTIHHSALDKFGAIKNVRYPFIAKDGTWWVVNWIPFTGPAPVLYSYNKKKNEWQAYEKIRPYKTTDTYYEIWNIFQQSNGAIWIYGMGLLAYYDTTTKRFANISSTPFLQNGIEYDYVSHLYEDKEKNIWVSTNNGLYRFNTDAQVFRNIRNRRPGDTTIVHNAVSAIVPIKNNGTWVSTWGSGVFSYNKDWQPIPNPVTQADPQNKNLHASYMMQRQNGEVWIGTQTGELKIYDPGVNKSFSSSPSVLKNEIIMQLMEDHAGNTWIGTSTGLLVKCVNGNWKDTAGSFKTILGSAGDIFKIFEDNRHHIWVCTATDGLYELDPEGRVLRQFREKPDDNTGLLNNGASDIVQYNDSIYLIASNGLCIFNNNTSTFRYVTAAEGLPAENITTLTLDKEKRLWVGLDGGLYRLNIDNNLYVSFDAADGIKNDIIQVGSSSLLPDGQIAMGTPYDFLVFDPEKTIDKKEAPPVHITGFLLGGARLSVDSIQTIGELNLPYNKTFIRLELSTLTFRDAYYMYYLLEGLDKDWKRVYNTEITYQYLPPGDYTLKLKSMNGEGSESRFTELKIKVAPPFWQTWWFYCTVLLLIGALLFWIDHRRVKRKTALLKMRSDIADNLHRDINAALSNITILSKMASIKADNEPEKSKEFIEEIHTKSENMTLAMDDMLWSIDPYNDSMEKLMLRFREYINTLKSQYHVQVDVLIDKKAESLPIQMKLRNDVLWLFKGGIKNVIRTGGRNCRIHIGYEKPDLTYTLEFEILSTDMKQLNNLRQRGELSGKLQELGAKLKFEVHKTSASFLLSIPLKSS